jgi:hypothetical protein
MSDELEVLTIPQFEGETIEDLVDTVELFVLLNNFPFKKQELSEQDIKQVRSIAPVIDALNKLRLVAYSIDGRTHWR